MSTKFEAARKALSELLEEFDTGRKVYEAVCHLNHGAGNGCMVAQVITHRLHIEQHGDFDAILGERILVAGVDSAAEAEEIAMNELDAMGYFFDKSKACQAANDKAAENTESYMSRPMCI